MAAITGRRAQMLRVHELALSVQELTRDRNRDPVQVADVLQVIKDHKDFAECFLGEPIPRFGVWRTATLGTGQSVENLLRALQRQGRFDVSLGLRYNALPGTFAVSPRKIEVRLVCVTGVELGFNGNVRYGDVCARAQEREMELELCPPELGLQLRLQYTDQPRNSRVILGMEPIHDVSGLLVVFALDNCDGRLGLYNFWHGPDYSLSPKHRFVFVRSRRTLQ